MTIMGSKQPSQLETKLRPITGRLLGINKPPVVYVAGKYRSKWYGYFNILGVAVNIRKARKVAKELFRKGIVALCPHSNSAFFDFFDKVPDEIILPACIELMKRCDAVLVLPNWVDSSGTKVEIEEARKANIPVFYFQEDLDKYIERSQTLRKLEC